MCGRNKCGADTKNAAAASSNKRAPRRGRLLRSCVHKQAQLQQFPRTDRSKQTRRSGKSVLIIKTDKCQVSMFLSRLVLFPRPASFISGAHTQLQTTETSLRARTSPPPEKRREHPLRYLNSTPVPRNRRDNVHTDTKKHPDAPLPPPTSSAKRTPRLNDTLLLFNRPISRSHTQLPLYAV